MAEHNETGIKGEQLAAEYLKQRGYEVCDINWRFKHLELDIVAKKSGTVCFVEVKTRTGFNPALPQDSVDRKKQRLLIQAANYYLEIKNIDAESQFDIVAINLFEGKAPKIVHIQEAFYPEVNRW